MGLYFLLIDCADGNWIYSKGVIILSLRHTILAMLETGEGTGYGIAKKFQGTFGFFWSASHQQVYQELAKLAKDKLVEFNSIEQIGKPDKKVYRITPIGHKELTRWIEKHMDLPKIKDELMVKMVVGHLVPPSILRDQINRQRDLHVKKLEGLKQFAEESFGDTEEISPKEKLKYYTLKRGIQNHESWLQWAEEVEQVLDEIELSLSSTTESDQLENHA